MQICIVVHSYSLLLFTPVQAQVDSTATQSAVSHDGYMIILFALLAIVLGAAIFLKIKTSEVIITGKRKKKGIDTMRLNQYINTMNSNQIEEFLLYKERMKNQEEKEGGKNLIPNFSACF